jgi:hypothetical protein
MPGVVQGVIYSTLKRAWRGATHLMPGEYYVEYDLFRYNARCAVVRCPVCCRTFSISSADHVINADGLVPNVTIICPDVGCTYRAYIRLMEWDR